METILFIAPPFFDYPVIINRELSKRYNVVQYPLYPKNFVQRIVSFLGINSVTGLILDNHYRTIENDIVLHEYSFAKILIIKGSLVPDFFYKWLKRRYSSAQFIQYLWDDIRIDQKALTTFDYFDKILSFNLVEAQKYKLEFRPFFFREKLLPIENRRYDLVGVFSYSNYRAQVLDSVCKILHQDNTKYKIHIKGSKLLYLLNHSKAKMIREFYSQKSISYEALIETISQSRAELEIPNPLQIGLTTRPFEALGTETKIITTAESIREYDFYSPDNISIISPYNVKIDLDWLRAPYKKLNSEIINKYSLKTFIDDILK